MRGVMLDLSSRRTPGPGFFAGFGPRKRSWVPTFVGMTAIAGWLCAAPVSAATTVFTNATIGTGAGQTIEGGTLVVRDGRIASVGVNAPVPPGATVVDATGKWITPGIVAGFTDIGINEVEGVDQTNDTGAGKSPFSAAIDVSPALNGRATPIAINRVSGVTRAAVAPAATSEIFGGQGALIRLSDGVDILDRPRAFQFIELGEDGAKIAGGSRPAAWLNLRNGFLEAQRYARNPAAFDSGRDRDSLIKRLDAEALVPVVDGRIPALIHAERASDILSVLRLKAEFPRLRIILTGAREGWMVASQIAAAKVPVLTLALYDLPDGFENLASTRSNIGRLVAAGVLVGLGAPDGNSGFQPRNLPYLAGNLVAQARVPGGVGLTREQALETITRNTAEIFGMAGLGTLTPGSRADVVLWDGDPLELMSAPVAVMIDGVPQPMVSRQTLLRDRYIDLNNSQLPPAYKP